MSFSGSDFLAWWGAGLSTALGFLKLADAWNERFRVETSYSFNSLPEDGNRVMIRNLTGRPLILGFWELLYASETWPRRRFEPLISPDPEFADEQRIEAHSSLTLSFVDTDHFDWSAKARNGRSIWIRLHIAGRRPLLRKVYP